jgi:hypothetical protein
VPLAERIDESNGMGEDGSSEREGKRDERETRDEG